MPSKDYELVTKTYRAQRKKVEEASERAKEEGTTLSEVLRIFVHDYADRSLDLPAKVYI